MTKISKKTDSIVLIIQGIARGISTTFMAFLLLMAIRNATTGGQYRRAPWPTLEDIILALFFLAMLAGVIIAWRREGLGGFILIIVGSAATVAFMLTMPARDYWVMMIICAPFLVSGILYLICWRRLSTMKSP